MNYSLQNHLLKETTRYVIRPSEGAEDSLQDLAAQYLRASTDTQKGNIGEAIALIYLGLIRGELTFGGAQTNALNTNKWNASFPFVDIMSEPLDANSGARSALETVFWSVKTGSSPTNFGSLWRLANFPHWTGRGRAPIGLRDLMTITSEDPRILPDTPDEITLSIGYVHVSGEGNRVFVRIFEPNEITFRKTRRTVMQQMIDVGRDRMIRGRRLAFWCQSNFYYEPIGIRATTARQFWTRRSLNESIRVSNRELQDIRAEMIPPHPTRRSIARSLSRGGRSPRGVGTQLAREISRLAELPDEEFYRNWRRGGNRYERVFNFYSQRWMDNHQARLQGLDPRTARNFRARTLSQERTAALEGENLSSPEDFRNARRSRETSDRVSPSELP